MSKGRLAEPSPALDESTPSHIKWRAEHSLHSLMQGRLTNRLNRRLRALLRYGSYTVETRESSLVSLKRASQRRTTKRTRYMAMSGAIPHDQYRLHDGQEWLPKPFPAHQPIRTGTE